MSILTKSGSRWAALISPLAVALVSISGCTTTTPSTRIDRLAQSYGFEKHRVEGSGFEHVVYEKPGNNGGSSLHVYLEGDGLPWLSDTRISSDPTPRRAYALELMALDSAPSLYVGRPCYYGTQSSNACSTTLWTDQRYSAAVVESMEAAIRKIAATKPERGLVLIGYSGGGVLAMLLAERLAETEVVVTIAANLDVDAWCELHGFSPLAGSLNPASRGPLPRTIQQIHLAGEKDGQVPPEIVASVVAVQPASEYLLYPGFDHTCCWLEIWPQVLQLIGKSHH